MRPRSLLINVGEYQHGSDPTTDTAIERMDGINAFLRQKMDEVEPCARTLADLVGQ